MAPTPWKTIAVDAETLELAAEAAAILQAQRKVKVSYGQAVRQALESFVGATSDSFRSAEA